MKTHSYHGLTSVALAVNRVIGASFGLLGIVVAVFASSVYMGDPTADGVLCIGWTWGIGAAIIGLFFTFSYPTVILDEDGVGLRSWPFPVLRVPWKAILEVHEGRFLKRRLVFVRVKSLTPLHVLYGLYFLRRFETGFLIRMEIRDFDALKQALRQKRVH